MTRPRVGPRGDSTIIVTLERETGPAEVELEVEWDALEGCWATDQVYGPADMDEDEKAHARELAGRELGG